MLYQSPKLLDGINCESKVKIIEGKGIEACSLACNTLRVEGLVRVLRWD
jgi:hypothetical protein